MTAPVVSLTHPLTVGVERLEAALDAMPIGGWDGLDEAEARRLAEELVRIEPRVKAHLSAVLRVLDEAGVAKRSGASSTGAMLAASFGGDRAAGDRMVKTGKALRAAPVVNESMAAGRVTEPQAKVIAAAVETVPEQFKTGAQDALLADAKKLTLPDLRRRALRVADTYKPANEADADENASLEQREQRAWAASKFRMWPNGDGTHSGDFTLPDAQASILESTLQSISAPRRDHLHEHVVPEDAGTPAKLGRAFAEMSGRLSAETLMGQGPTVVITLDFDVLTDKVKAATLSTGVRISREQIRQVACDADIIPAVLGGRSRPLDLGRQKRLFDRHQKIAMGVRDHGCAFPGCDRPPEWCEAHHWRDPWSKGGTTNLADGVLLCAHHHRIVHHQRWRLREADDGIIEFQHPNSTVWKRNHTRWRP